MQFTASLDQLPKMLEYAQEQILLPTKEKQEFTLALEEALVNIINYAYKSQEKGAINLVIQMAENAVEAVIIDWGTPFDPTKAAAPPLNRPLEERPIGGLGVHFMRTFTNALTYERGDHCNILRLKKWLITAPV